jgi:hypothetical protein
MAAEAKPTRVGARTSDSGGGDLLEAELPLERRRVCLRCRRVAQRSKPWCWFCDPDVPAELKLEARRRRSRLVLEDVDLSTPMSRRHVREAIAQGLLDGDVTDSRATALAKLISDQAREDLDAKRGQAPDAAQPLIVEVQRFGPTGENGAAR